MCWQNIYNSIYNFYTLLLFDKYFEITGPPLLNFSSSHLISLAGSQRPCFGLTVMVMHCHGDKSREGCCRTRPIFGDGFSSSFSPHRNGQTIKGIKAG